MTPVTSLATIGKGVGLNPASSSLYLPAANRAGRSRARPTFLYVGNLVILCNYWIFPLAGCAPIAFPKPLFWLFASVMLRYVVARSSEKISGVKGAD
jgi:hypothetical protein